ncbi:MAG TPA: hypothetical protein VFH78_07805 [Candidatus Thermoplasmatota archaeon]|nr:hypothetical protein [Candidatus Thermoplasmatota archaeon]
MRHCPRVAAIVGLALLFTASGTSAQGGGGGEAAFLETFLAASMPEPTPEGEAVAPWPSVAYTAAHGAGLPSGETGGAQAVPRNMVAPESGYRDDGPYPHPFHLRFDGVDDVLVIEPATTAQRHTSITVIVRAAPSDAYRVLATFVSNAAGAGEPRQGTQLALDPEGRPVFSLDPTRPELSVTMADPITDGEWHQVTAWHHVLAGAGGENDRISLELSSVGLSVAAEQAAHTETALVEDATSAGARGRYHVGGVASDAGAVAHAFAGDLAGIWIDQGGLSDAATRAPARGEAANSDGAQLDATSSSTEGAIRFEVAFDGASGATIVAIDEAGAEHELGAGATAFSWLAPQAGRYRFEARDYGADGSYTVLASDTALAMPAPRAPADIALAALAATAVVGLSAALAARGVDLWELLRGITLGRAQDRFYSATKEARLEKRVRLGSISAALVAIALMSIILSAGRRLENVLQGAFVAVFAVAGLAAIAFTIAMTGAQVAIARAEHATPRYRLWVAGALSLAVSTLAFGIPFGFAGNLSRDAAPGAPVETPRQKGLGAIAAICLGVAAAPLFLAIGAFTRFAFAEVAVALALGGVFVSSLPIAPLPGRAVWSWSKGASIALLAGTFLLQSAYHLGALGAWTIVGIGLAALVLAAALTVLRVRGREERERASGGTPTRARTRGGWRSAR